MKRLLFVRRMRRINPDRLVFVDESGANIAMGRSHAWVQKGHELIDPRPMNWGDNLTMIGAMRRRGWVCLGTMFKAANAERFVCWVRDRLAPKLSRGDVVVMDNAKPHKDPRVTEILGTRGAALVFLPPYSPDLNPIEPAWGLCKKHIRAHAPRHPVALRRVALAARRRIRPAHCRSWFSHAGY